MSGIARLRQLYESERKLYHTWNRKRIVLDKNFKPVVVVEERNAFLEELRGWAAEPHPTNQDLDEICEYYRVNPLQRKYLVSLETYSVEKVCLTCKRKREIAQEEEKEERRSVEGKEEKGEEETLYSTDEDEIPVWIDIPVGGQDEGLLNAPLTKKSKIDE